MEPASGGPSTDARRYPNVLRALAATPWAILEETWSTICEIVELRVSGNRLSDEEIRERIGSDFEAPQPYLAFDAARGGARSAGGAVAVLPIYGVIMPRATVLSQFSGGTSLEVFGAQLRAAVDNPDVGSILLDIDSPGGSVSLVPETAELIREAKVKKPVYAIANALAASAAYHLASQATELIVTPSGIVGSIGVFTTHDDLSVMAEMAGVKRTYISAGRKKVDGNPFGPLSEEALADMQALVDGFYDLFVGDVAKGRGVTKAAVRNGFAEGGVASAVEAKTLGMVDRIASFDATLSRLVRGGGARAEHFAEDDKDIVISIDPTYQGDAKALAEKIRAELFGRAPESKIDDEPEAPVEVDSPESTSLLPGAERLLSRSFVRQSLKATPKKED